MLDPLTPTPYLNLTTTLLTNDQQISSLNSEYVFPILKSNQIFHKHLWHICDVC